MNLLNLEGQFRMRTLGLAGLILAGAVGLALALGDRPHKVRDFPLLSHRAAAPQFPDGMEWLNTDRPLPLSNLRGKIVLLDFWTYCCINCMHIIPDLKRLEKKYPNELVVIGVHSAKFSTEKETENIRQAILRYEIEHPVVNDRDLRIWRSYGVPAWPTLVLIDPEGNIVKTKSGEGVFKPFDQAIAVLVQQYDAMGKLDREPLQLTLERSKAREGILSFPGKVLADADQEQLFIADSNHNRIVITDLDGKIQEVIGTGLIGYQDGPLNQAQFNHPQGMAIDGKKLYVADTENHAIRQIDLESWEVTTLAGTGTQADWGSSGGDGPQTKLNSPWGLVMGPDRHSKILYIAMAGSHQLWALNLETRKVYPFAGSGREALLDGDLKRAALAQPSGITTDGKKLYFADSEVSAVRSADLPPGRKVQTLVGQGLFDFGDVDGIGPQARLQHPLGIVFYEDWLYVADTYNNKIKRIHPETALAESFLGYRHRGNQDGTAPLFDEPGGISAAGGKLYIADTNNHAIRIADIETQSVSTLELSGLEKLEMETASRIETILLPPQEIAPGLSTLLLEISFPDDLLLSAGAPTQVILTQDTQRDGRIEFKEGIESIVLQPEHFPVKVPVQLKAGQQQLQAELALYYCEKGKTALCYFKQVRLQLPLQIKAGAPSQPAQIRYTLPLRD